MGASNPDSGRFVCVHGHFYQPPRENPWLGALEREETATPFHDWNERISEECYGPFALDDLLQRVSFNFGPTLLSWMERAHPNLYRRVIAADRLSAGEDGLGNAIAQPYIHAILPLAARREKETLVRWGLADFSARFSRKSLGLWLPETAVDDETLDVAAAEGVKFVILDPSQAAEVRSEDEEWAAVTAQSLETNRAYRWISPIDDTRSLAVFFYHRELSSGIVSGKTTRSGEAFASAVRDSFRNEAVAEMTLIASDGEFYGHHNRGAEVALGEGLRQLEEEGIRSINPARFLRLCPPDQEVLIQPRTSWSCTHGLGRWENDCGCRSTSLPNWSQSWRGPLREAVDRLAKRLDALYEDEAGVFFDDPWGLRDAFLSRGAEEHDLRFIKNLAQRPFNVNQGVRLLRALEMQRQCLAMFTSCGWFFDDPSGIETVAILQRAAHAIDLSCLLGENPEDAFIARLTEAKSNVASFSDAAGVYCRLVEPTRVGVDRLAAHAAILDHLELWPSKLPPQLNVDIGPAVRVEKQGLAGHDRALSVRTASVRRDDTREEASWHAIVRRADGLDFCCWLAPKTADFDVAALGLQFLAQDDDAFREALDARFGTYRFGFDAVLSDERTELRKAFASEQGLGAERALFVRRWVRAVVASRGGGREDRLLLELMMSAREHGFLAENLPWAFRLPEELQSRLEEALVLGGATTVSRALSWLDAMGLAGLKIGEWRLRDFSRRWSEKLSSQGPSVEKDACRALSERLGETEAILEKA